MRVATLADTHDLQWLPEYNTNVEFEWFGLLKSTALSSHRTLKGVSCRSTFHRLACLLEALTCTF